MRAAVSAATRPLILIHDAARPLLSRAVIDNVLAGMDGHEGAPPALDAPRQSDAIPLTVIAQQP